MPRTRLLVVSIVGVLGALAVTNSGTGCGCREPTSVGSVAQGIASCNCYNKTNPFSGSPGRLFVDNSNEDFVLLEDPGTKDVYRWSGSGRTWSRIGSSARGYAAGRDMTNNSVVYRLSGAGFVDMKAAAENDEFAFGHCRDSILVPCESALDCPSGQTCLGAGMWVRASSLVSRDLFVSAGVPYIFGPINNNTTQYGLTAFNDPSAGGAHGVDTVNGTAEIAATRYVEDTSGSGLLYKKSSNATYVYHANTEQWTQIGNTTTALWAGAGTVFTQDATGTVWKYHDTPLQWDMTSGMTNASKIVGNASGAYALSGGTLYQLNGITWTPMPGIASVSDIGAGPSHLYAVKSDGTVLQWNGSWEDISCSGAVSTANCAGPGATSAAGCEPGPIPTGVAPSYMDSQEMTQNNTANYDVLMQHNDPERTGAATHENVLTPALLDSGNFGYLGSIPIPGKIYAQPLYIEQAAVVCRGTCSQSSTISCTSNAQCPGGETCAGPHSPLGLQNANIAYIATLENQILAVDVDQRTVCWSTKAFGCPQPTWGFGCGNSAADGACNPNFDCGPHAEGGIPGVRIGIVSTPVIDKAHDVMYVMSRTRDGDDARGRFFLNTVNTRTGDLIAKVEAIADTLNGRNDCAGQALHPSQVTNRAGLLLLGNAIYAAFSANSGENTKANYHGSVLAFDVSNPASPQNKLTSFCATPTSNGGGIWMAGGGIASDGTNAYFTTGNGSYPPDTTCNENDLVKLSTIPEGPPPGNYPDSFVKLSPAMTATGYTDKRTAAQLAIAHPGDSNSYLLEHCPVGICDGHCEDHTCFVGTTTTHLACVQHSIFWSRERSDADLGSGGVLVAGGRLIGGGKDGRLYVLDPSTMTLKQDFQAFIDNYDLLSTFTYDTNYYAGPHLHGGPVAWDPGGAYIYIYGWSEKDHLKRFRFNKTSHLIEAADATPVSPENPFPTAHGDLGSGPNAMPGGMLSISWNGSDPTTAIIWATVQEPYKPCTKVEQVDTPGVCSWRVVVDQPAVDAGVDKCTGTGNVGPFEIDGCNTLNGYVPGRLYAFAAEADGSNRLRLLWGDTVSPPVPAATQLPPGTDPGPNNYIPAYAKHTPPTIAHGKVLIATANNELRIYGLGSAHRANHPEDPPLPKPEFVRDDIALTGIADWTTIPVASSNGDGTFTVTNSSTAWFPGWSSAAGVKRLVGDFNNDGRADIALTGISTWTTIPLASGNGDGSFTVTNSTVPSFSYWASGANVTALVGDFTGDKRADIALTGAAGWTTIPLAASNGDGSFSVTNLSSPSWAARASAAGVQPLAGDFNGDGKTDIALVGAQATFGWSMIPTAFSNGNGSLLVTERGVNSQLCCFTSWAADASALKLVGDFNGDAKADIALLGEGAWRTIRIAFSSGDGTYRVKNTDQGNRSRVGTFVAWAAQGLAGSPRVLVGDFNGDGRSDIALLAPTLVDGQNNPTPIPIAFSNGDGTFRITQSTFFNANWWSTWESAVSSSGATSAVIVADFDHDGTADIALTGVPGWVTIPVALSNGDGTFRIVNGSNSWFAGVASSSAAKLPGNYR